MSQFKSLLVLNEKQIRKTPTKRVRKGAKSGEHSVGGYKTGKARYSEDKTYTNELSSQGKRALWTRYTGGGRGEREQKSCRENLPKWPWQDGLGKMAFVKMARKTPNYILEIRSGKAKRGGGDKQKGS